MEKVEQREIFEFSVNQGLEGLQNGIDNKDVQKIFQIYENSNKTNEALLSIFYYGYQRRDEEYNNKNEQF